MHHELQMGGFLGEFRAIHLQHRVEVGGFQQRSRAQPPQARRCPVGDLAQQRVRYAQSALRKSSLVCTVIGTSSKPPPAGLEMSAVSTT